MTAKVRIAGGSVHVTRAVYDQFFGALETIILLRRMDDLLLLPTRGAVAGGSLLKLRNSAGDRVVHAMEFFRDNGIADDIEFDLELAWSAQNGAFEVPGFFRLQR